MGQSRCDPIFPEVLKSIWHYRFFGLAREAVTEFGLRDLEGNRPVEPRITGAEDLAHATFADGGFDEVGADALARGHQSTKDTAWVQPGKLLRAVDIEQVSDTVPSTPSRRHTLVTPH